MGVSESILCILMGIGFVSVGLLNKQFKAGYRNNSDQSIPRWLGMMAFLVMGGLFTVAGLIDLIRALQQR